MGGDFQAGPNGDPLHTKDVELTVVGTALTPILGESDLANEAIVPYAAIAAAGGTTAPRLMFTRIKGRTQPVEFTRTYPAEMLTDVVPARIVNLHRVRSLPIAGAMVAALLGVIVLAYTLAVGVRRVRANSASCADSACRVGASDACSCGRAC